MNLRRIVVFALCIGAFGVALLAFRSVVTGGPDPEAARAALARSEAYLKASNASAARSQAFSAVRADPRWGEAHLALARASLALDEGVAGEAALRRAIDSGIDPKRAHAMMALAILLQGDPRRALAESDKAPQTDRLDALRVRTRAFAAMGNLAAAQQAALAAVQLAPQSAGAWTELGRFRLNAGDVVGAIEAAGKATALDKGNTDALILRGELVRAQYGLVASLPWFEAALKRDPYRHAALIQYASTLGDAGQTRAMLAVTRRAMEVRPRSPQAFYLQAVLAARAEQFGLARDLLQRAGSGVAALPGGLLLGGSLDLQEGRYERAIEKLRNLVSLQPMNITARKLLATALLRSDASKNGIEALLPVVARGDADAYALSLVARGYERIGDRQTAARYFDRASYPARDGAAWFSSDDALPMLTAAAQRAPADDPRAAIPLIRGLIDGGDKSAALAKAQEIAQRNPGAPAAHSLVGDTLMLLKQPGEAVRYYKDAASIRFDEATMLRLVEALDRSGQRQEASTTLALFLSQNPLNLAALRLSASWQTAAGDYDAAIDSLEAVRLRTGNRDAGLLADLAFAYAGAGEPERAAHYAEAAYLLAPSNPAVAGVMGWTLAESGDLEGGIELLQKAVALAPRHPMLRWQLAQAYAEAGRNADAKAQAQAAMAIPGFADRSAAEALIAKLA
ncbi:tetratricopeptide repeat protein [Sphingomonas sp. BT-65]|uniref:tetratricopeptide repeat protein n=1 Tax=Sphingomonas sp. BT-65 TaxID=2989821 RepID=UPI0022357AB2|nr:tetratricopeptide repeat protein [Sphingomonas sp. BT-65]MCW4461628.1 tetratricopeptide repeat protein [Sphingomonas sp. BT-65]